MRWFPRKRKDVTIPIRGTPNVKLDIANTDILRPYSAEMTKHTDVATGPIKKSMPSRCQSVEAILDRGDNGYLLPVGFTQADALMAVILNWTTPLKIDISAYPKVSALRDKVFARPAAQKALKEEGLI